MVEVVKRDSSTKIFDSAKIKSSIKAAIDDAGYTLEKVKNITNEIIEEA